MKCPYRITPAGIAAQRTAIKVTQNDQLHPYAFLKRREITSGFLPLPVIPANEVYQSAGVTFLGYSLHSKRITAADWHPNGETILSADKNGAVRLWSVRNAVAQGRFQPEKLTNDEMILSPHRCNVNTFAFTDANAHVAYLSSSDGTISEIDINTTNKMDREDGGGDLIFNFNPNGFVSPSTFVMVYGLSYDNSRQCLYAGTTKGSIVRLDPRANQKSFSRQVSARFHSDKITTIDVNPMRSDLIATASNDATVRVWDARKMLPDHQIGSYTHDRIVSSAYFSPKSGAKLLTTSIDNRIRVWPDVHVFQGDVNTFTDAQPITFVHSHDFHRYLSPFRATWDPKDWREDLFMCGRFLGEAYIEPGDDDQKPCLLHPIDLFSVRAEAVVHSMVDSSLILTCTINKFCPVADVVLTAASRNLYIWSVPSGSDGKGALRRAAGDDDIDRRGPARRGDDDDDDDDNGDGGGRRGGRSVRKKPKLGPSVTVRRSARPAVRKAAR